MVGMIYCIIVCFGVPLAALAFAAWKKKGYVWSFLTGAAVFTVFQILTRVPLLQHVLPYQSWFIQMQYKAPLIVSSLFFAFTAGLFEEVGRFAGFKVLRRRRESWLDGVFFGLGHGGTEAVWMGWQIVQTYGTSLPQINYLVIGFERMCTIVVHVGLTMVVLQGIRDRKMRWLLGAIALHTAIDLLAPMLAQVSPAASEAALFLIAIGFLPYIMHCKKTWKKGEM